MEFYLKILSFENEIGIFVHFDVNYPKVHME